MEDFRDRIGEKINDLFPFIIIMAIILGGHLLTSESGEVKKQKEIILNLNIEKDSLINTLDSITVELERQSVDQDSISNTGCIIERDSIALIDTFKIENYGLDGKRRR